VNRRVAWASLVLLVLIVGGCATAPQGGDTRRGSAPRVRCLSDAQRDATDSTRPLFFLFCIESP